MLKTLKGMLHHVYICVRVKDIPPSKVTSLLQATTSLKEAIQSVNDKSASSLLVGLKEEHTSIYRGYPLLQRQA